MLSTSYIILKGFISGFLPILRLRRETWQPKRDNISKVNSSVNMRIIWWHFKNGFPIQIISRYTIPWEDKPVIDDIAQSVKTLIGSAEHGSLHIDESGIPKQGNHSVGVTQQYCGRLGKVDNCQMGVFLGYANGSSRILVDKWILTMVNNRGCLLNLKPMTNATSLIFRMICVCGKAAQRHKSLNARGIEEDCRQNENW